MSEDGSRLKDTHDSGVISEEFWNRLKKEVPQLFSGSSTYEEFREKVRGSGRIALGITSSSIRRIE